MEKLGIEPSLLLAQIINFAIIVAVLTKLLYRPILGVLAKRKRDIEEAAEKSEHIRQEESKLAAKKEKLMAEARGEARLLIEDAKSRAKEVERDIIAGAHKDAADILEKAKREADATHETLAGDIRREAVNLASAMTKRLVASILSPKDQHTLIAKHLAGIAKQTAL